MASTTKGKISNPGLYEFADSKAFHQLTQHQELKIKENLERGKKWTLHKEEYETLYKRLEGLCDQTQYQAMIPIAGSKAFMPGRLENTNEIMVLLGDNWFADRSVKQARDMCKRRIEKCDSMLKDLETEKKLFENWRKETLNLENSTEDGATEIREPYEEAEEKKWREEHRHKVKEYKMNKKNSLPTEDENEDLWRRLDELEIEEELEANDQVESGNESEDWSQSPPLSDDESDKIVIQDPSFKPPILQRRVSFGGVTQVNLEDLIPPSSSEDSKVHTIKFSHTQNDNHNQNTNELNPGHLKDIFDDGRAPKSIMKPFEASSILLAPEGEEISTSTSNFKTVREPFVDPVQEKIVEKNPIEGPAKETTGFPERKASRFKLSRLNN